MKRREFLKAGIAAGGAALIPGGKSAAQKDNVVPRLDQTIQEKQML